MNTSITFGFFFYIVFFFIPSSICGQKNQDRVGSLNLENITKKTTEKELVHHYGTINVTRDTIYVEEDMYEIGTKLFPDTANELLITWKDTKTFLQPKWIIIRKPTTQWYMANGIAIGSDLKTLERLNESPFCFLGFGWGLQGTVIDWNGGALEKVFSEYDRVIIKLSPEIDFIEIPELFIGDTEINSSHSAMQIMNPKVYEVLLEF